jgi:hypothetical protein
MRFITARRKAPAARRAAELLQGSDTARAFWQRQAQACLSNPDRLEMLPAKTATAVRLVLAARHADREAG